MVRAYGASPVCLVDLVCFVYLADLVHLVSFVQPKKPDKPNNGLLTLADFFSILIEPRLAGCGLCEAGIRNGRVKERLVAIFFSLDSFQQLFF